MPKKLPYSLIGGKQILLAQFNSQLVAELRICYLLIQFANQLIERTHTINIYGSFLEPPIKLKVKINLKINELNN